MSVLSRNQVTVSGSGPAVLVFSHDVGCDQQIWRHVAPPFERGWRVVRFDHVGCGRSAPDAHDRARYSTLHAYASDLLDVCDALGASQVVLAGHGLGATISLLAAIREPRRVARLVLIAPSPRLLHDEGYRGAFSREETDALLSRVDQADPGWEEAIASRLAARGEGTIRAEVAAGLKALDPVVAPHLLRVALLSDIRADLAHVETPSLVIQGSEDPISHPGTGEYLDARLPRSTRTTLLGLGHYPHVAAADVVVTNMRQFITGC